VLKASITIKPPPLSADSKPAFAFASANGVAPALGFQCELRSIDANTTAALHPWEACASPKAYTGLQDGSYVFAVRIKGEAIAELWSFVVDANAPNTTILPVRSVSPSTGAKLMSNGTCFHMRGPSWYHIAAHAAVARMAVGA
jgi:hypothetical protein